MDTNGAGDSFVGGFLAAWHQDKNFEECMQVGIKMASAVVQQISCQFPEKVSF